MSGENVLFKIANELPIIVDQLKSSDPLLRAAGIQRLEDFCGMTERWRTRRVSRRNFLRAGATFAALSIGREID